MNEMARIKTTTSLVPVPAAYIDNDMRYSSRVVYILVAQEP